MRLLLADPVLQNFSTTKKSSAKTLAIILVGESPASELYVSIKQEEAKKYGVHTHIKRLPETATEDEIKELIASLNHDDAVNGLIIQLPLPAHVNTDRILDCVKPSKDVDNLTGSNHFISPMVQAVAALKDFYRLDFTNKQLCVIGRGRLVGTPIAEWLRESGHEVVSIDENTENKDEIIRSSDILFGGAGWRYVIREDNTRPEHIIFDCSGKDADFEAIKDKVAAITPAKGGIGPLTVHFLLMNVLKA